MLAELYPILQKALSDKKLNDTAYNEILKWLTEEEFIEFIPELSRKIEQDEWENLMDSFYRNVSFGTAGTRGIMDIGTNRINNYTIRWASQAYAQYLLKYQKEHIYRGVAIAYDSRNHSQEFMEETARVLAANDVLVHVFDFYRATPELSFAVRTLKCIGGIVITASHNPPEFNGYKVYDQHGIQELPEASLRIEAEFVNVKKIKKISFEEALKIGKIKYIGREIDAQFANCAKKADIYPGRDIKIVFSPLHGVGSQSVLPILQELGFKDIELVKEQMSLDGNFPNVEGHYPNPEFPVIYKQAIDLAKRTNADLVLISDPDADRLGMAIPTKKGEWTTLTGNQGAVLMAYFILESLSKTGKLPKNPVMVKTSVTTDLFRDICEDFEVEAIADLLVGFKFIGDRIEHLSPDKNFIFAAEETNGYLFGTDYRDKGAETPAVIIAEMVAYCKDNKTTPSALLESIYQKYGYYSERVYNRVIEGFGSFEQMNMAMKELRANIPKEIGGRKILKVLDRMTSEVKDGQTGEILETRDWDRGDMLSFFFTEDERTCLHVRPSGTEPKMKYYTAVKGDLSKKTKDEIRKEAEALEKDMAAIFEGILNTIKVDVFS